VDFTKRGRIFDEFLDIVQRLWAGETVSHDSDFFRFENAQITPLPKAGRIPLYIGGFVGKALDRVVKHGDGYFGSEDAVPAFLEKFAATGREPAEARVRIPGLYIAVARDPERAMEELGPYYHHIVTTYAAWNAEDNALGMESAPDKPLTLEEFKKSGMLQIWTPEQAVSKFKDMQERMPIEHFMMAMPSGLPAERFVEYAEVFANEVIPAFQ
ncbi:MAG: LLM class flavin-dependent oxidoreductase, partial [Novosphingobium sp.]|nr:LLM class flavin-dependent oxidoreductase [Novosphingobium sp.]